MNGTLILAAATALVLLVNTAHASHHLFDTAVRQIAEQTSQRNLQNNNNVCSTLQPVAANIFAAVFSTTFECDTCGGRQGIFTLKCSSTEQACCDEYCGFVSTDIEFFGSGTNLTPRRQSSCVTYTSGLDETQCVDSIYCSNSPEICECAININNETCNACTPCLESEGYLSVLFTLDCSNIRTELVTTECDQSPELLKIVCPEAVGNAPNDATATTGTTSEAASSNTLFQTLYMLLTTTILFWLL